MGARGGRLVLVLVLVVVVVGVGVVVVVVVVELVVVGGGQTLKSACRSVMFPFKNSTVL